MAQRPRQKKRLVSAVVLAELQWTSAPVPYLSLSTCPGEFGRSNRKQQQEEEEEVDACQIRM